MAFTPEFVRTLAQQEYCRINRELYNNGLPRWGSFNFRVTSGRNRVGAVYTVSNGHIRTMAISRQRSTVEELLDTIRHETAHIVEFTYQLRSGLQAGNHGREWQFHARVCGVREESVRFTASHHRVPLTTHFNQQTSNT